ncbi:MAG: hypothetical protein HY064_03000 [Bacteroidetes bacterium]|nr:hypothetical protein [Bacteroidota bacterium]
MKKLITLAIFMSATLWSFAQYSHVAVGPNGNKIEEGQYNADPGILPNDSKEVVANKMASVYKIGVWKYWFDNGQLSAEEHYDNNGTAIGDWKTWHPSGQLASEVDKASGAAVYYHPNGQKAEEGMINASQVRTGAWKGWHDNGQLNYTGSYNANGEKNGTWTFYDSAGNVFATENYSNGTKLN